LYGEGKTLPPGILGVHARNGGFHIKAGLLDLDRPYFAAKVNANFPQNVRRFGLPLIQGVIVLCDGENGQPLSLMDSMEITNQRTGAATAVAAKYLARSDSKSLTICGCGNQGRVSVQALSRIFPLERVFVYDVDATRAQVFASELSSQLQVRLDAVQELGDAVKHSDICVTCTPSNEFFLKQEYVRPGTFIAAVGADNAEKQELDPSLVSQSKIVVDILEQCATIGELHHAVNSGSITKHDVHAELGEVVAGIRPGRTSSDEIIVFDSTGMALQDVISAAAVYKQAVIKGTGRFINFGK
jgi:ornithine cyclodeaminase/alanine dehydrogenase